MIPSTAAPDTGRGCGGQARNSRSPGPQSGRGTRLTLGPFAEPEEASGRLTAESQIEPWFACARPSCWQSSRWIGSSSEENDAEADCPADPEQPRGLVPQAVGADCAGPGCPAISDLRVCPRQSLS